MSKTRLSDPVRLPSGEITTIAELAKRGWINFTKSENFHRTAHSNPSVVYFADLNAKSGQTGSWEISPLAYQARTGQPIQL